MLQLQSKVETIDNSGASISKCIKFIGNYSFKKNGFIGDFVLISIKTLKLVRKVKKRTVYLGLIVQTKKKTSFLDGSYTAFSQNSIIFLNKKKRFLSTRIYGWISRKLRKKKYLRIIILSGRRLI